MIKSDFFSYSWHIDEKETEATVIRIYGLNSENKSVCVIVNDFLPYAYLELPEKVNDKPVEWTSSKAQLVTTKLNGFLGRHQPVTYEFVKKKRLYYANPGNKQFPYIRCCCSHPEDVKKLSYAIRKQINVSGIGNINLKIHEHNASPILQLTSQRKIPTAGWIVFLGKRTPKDNQVTYCDYEYIVSWKNMSEKKTNNVARPLIMGYDIEVNSTVPSSMPKHERPGDKVFQISCVFGRQGSKPDTYERYILTLGEVDEKSLNEFTKITARTFDTEHDLLLGFTDIIKEKQPNVIVGYNIFGFDCEYMLQRAKYQMCFNYNKQGMDKYGVAKEKTIEWSSSAYKNQSFQFLDAEGRIFVDLLPLVKRDYKMSNYQLKTIAAHFLKDMTKDPLDAKGIFKCYRIGMEGGEKGKKAMSLVGKYCVKDSELVVRLFETLTTWFALCEMSKVTNVPIFQLYTQGQQLKVFSQAYKKCTHENIVVEKDGYVAKENDHYVGATVFPPVAGVYERVIPFDFCLSGDTLISTSSGTSIRLKDFGNQKVVTWDGGKNTFCDGENKGLIYKGEKETVKIWLQDGTVITSTPDHKFMTDDGSWYEANELKDKYIKCGIDCPEDIKCEKEKEWRLDMETISLTMDTEENRENALAFSRMLGYILSDGSVYTTKNRKCCEVYLGTMIDSKNFMNDIKRFGREVTIRKRSKGIKGTTYCITIPASLSKSIHSLGNIVVGKRATQPMKLPCFIMDEKCPKSIVREFLAGLFGGDGTAPYLASKCSNFGNISFKWTTIEKLKKEMIEVFGTLQTLIKKFGIESQISESNIKYSEKSIKPKNYTNEPRIDILLSLKTKDTCTFAKTIGFRFCINKAAKLTIAASYNQMIDKVRIQNLNVYTNVIDQMNKDPSLTTANALKISRDKLFTTEPPLHELSKCSVKYIGYRKHEEIRHSERDKKMSMGKGMGLTSNYIKETNTESWFSTKNNKKYAVFGDSDTIPSFRKKVIAVYKGETIPVYDIFEVQKTHNFLANGVVASNCSLYPTTIIAYNISWDTLVTDEKIPDSDCHVMNWTDHISCIVKGTPITVGEYSIPIEQMNNYKDALLAYNEEKKGLTYYKQTNFYKRGVKKCLELTFEDGTTLECTPDHKILLQNGKWSEAQDIKINLDRIVCGYKPPHYNVDNREFVYGEFNFKGEKLIIFYKLLGLLITDGHTTHNRTTVYCGHKIDLQNLIRDINLLNPNSTSPKKINYGWGITILGKLGELFRNIEGITWGSKKGKRTFPKILDSATVPEIKAFLSGLFGGDGSTFSLSDKAGGCGDIGLSWSSEKEDELKESFLQLQALLKKCDIESTIKRNKTSTRIHILTKDIFKFKDTIGFAYCVHKSSRLEAEYSYLSMRQKVQEQQIWLTERVRNLKLYDTLENCTSKAIKELEQSQPIYNDYYAHPTKSRMTEYLRTRRKLLKPMFSKKYFPTPREYFESIGALKFFKTTETTSKYHYSVHKNDDVIPCLYKKLVYIRDIGEKEVYDLEIDDSHSFVANGIVVHNCNHDPKEIRKTELNKLIKEDDEKIKEIRKERDLKKNKDRKDEFNDLIQKIKDQTKPLREERSQLQKSKSKHVICAERKYRWLKSPMGVLPEILTHLLDTRSATKKEMKAVKAKLKEMKEGTDEYAELSTYHDVLDQRQLALKVSANSGYGCMGVRRGYLPFMPGAMATTYMGRKAIEKAAESIQKDWGGVLVYGDSVTGDTPILVKYPNETVDIKRIDALTSEWIDYDQFRSEKEDLIHKEQSPVNLQVWTNGKWSDIKRVIRHKTNKKIYRILTHTGCVDVTEDHSLLKSDLTQVKPEELKVGDSLFHSFPSNFTEFDVDIVDMVFNGRKCNRCGESRPSYEFYKEDSKTCKKCIYDVNHRYNEDAKEYFSDFEYLNKPSKLTKEEAFVWGFFMADGSAGKYDCGKYTWYICKQNLAFLERAKSYLEIVEPNFSFKILNLTEGNGEIESSKVYKLVPCGKVRLIAEKYSQLMYDPKQKTKIVPYAILNAEKEIREWFFEGYTGLPVSALERARLVGDGCKSEENKIIPSGMDCKGKIGAQGLYYLLKSIGYENVSINTRESKQDIFRINATRKRETRRKDPVKIKKIILLSDTTYTDYVYDLETTEGIFHAGIGEMIVKNTDSNYVNFPHLKTAMECWDHATKVAKEVSTIYPKPMSLAFEEKIYAKFMILTKKRYMSLACERDGVVDTKISKKGVLLNRRDNCEFVRKVYSEVIMSIFNKKDLNDILYYIITELNNVCSHFYSTKDFVITKSIGEVGEIEPVEGKDKNDKPCWKIGDYKIKLLPKDEEGKKKQFKLKNCDTAEEYYLRSLPAQVQLAEKMRNRGQLVAAGSRIEYVITRTGGHNAKQYEKVEDYAYFSKHNSSLDIDYLYYIKQLSNPLDQILDIMYKEKTFVFDQYKYRLSVRGLMLKELKSLFTPKLHFFS